MFIRLLNGNTTPIKIYVTVIRICLRTNRRTIQIRQNKEMLPKKQN